MKCSNSGLMVSARGPNTFGKMSQRLLQVSSLLKQRRQQSSRCSHVPRRAQDRAKTFLRRFRKTQWKEVSSCAHDVAVKVRFVQLLSFGTHRSLILLCRSYEMLASGARSGLANVKLEDQFSNWIAKYQIWDTDSNAADPREEH